MATGRSTSPHHIEVEYLLPMRWTSDEHLAELTGYLSWLARRMDVTVIDGSSAELFAAHQARFGSVRHVRPDPTISGKNGKVVGVLTGLSLARHERIIIADDDVRYSDQSLASVCSALGHWDVVRPQNYFVDLTWHSRWDTARTLVNRAFRSDFPGTLGVRRNALGNGYDPNVLFENLELIRTVLAAGGTELRANDIFVGRLSPSTRHFWSQRVRQAYDSMGQPPRYVAELLLAPLLIWAARRPRRLIAVVTTALAVAQLGRMRGGGNAIFPKSSVLLAPAWMGERAICAWLAFVVRLRGGVRYNDSTIRIAAHSISALRRSYGQSNERKNDAWRG